jgi:hypothetical protein
MSTPQASSLRGMLTAWRQISSVNFLPDIHRNLIRCECWRPPANVRNDVSSLLNGDILP